MVDIVSDDLELCDCCGDYVEANMSYYGLEVPLCLNCWIDKRNSED